MTSPSRFDPPGWMTADTPARRASSAPSAKGRTHPRRARRRGRRARGPPPCPGRSAPRRPGSPDRLPLRSSGPPGQHDRVRGGVAATVHANRRSAPRAPRGAPQAASMRSREGTWRPPPARGSRRARCAAREPPAGRPALQDAGPGLRRSSQRTHVVGRGPEDVEEAASQALAERLADGVGDRAPCRTPTRGRRRGSSSNACSAESAAATPHGFACLTITQAGLGSSASRLRAAARSSRLT